MPTENFTLVISQMPGWPIFRIRIGGHLAFRTIGALRGTSNRITQQPIQVLRFPVELDGIESYLQLLIYNQNAGLSSLMV